MAVYTIPIVNSISQGFSISLNNTAYYFNIIWRDAPTFTVDSAGWFLDIYNTIGVPIIQGLALVPQQNLLGQYKYLQLGFDLYLQGDGTVQGNPTYSNLGKNYSLYAVY
jgi:hypothetical protein